VKQDDLGEYEENVREKQKIQGYKVYHKLPLKLSHRDGKHQAPPLQRSKTRRIEEFGENVGQLPLCINKLHIYLSLLNMVSQKVVSHFNVFGSPVENWVMH
jgi:hypothetical protein